MKTYVVKIGGVASDQLNKQFFQPSINGKHKVFKSSLFMVVDIISLN